MAGRDKTAQVLFVYWFPNKNINSPELSGEFFFAIGSSDNIIRFLSESTAIFKEKKQKWKQIRNWC